MAFVAERPRDHGPLDPDLDHELGELSHILWRLRELTSLLVYRLEVQQLVLLSGRVRWVNIATEDVDAVIEAIRREEEVRTELLTQLAPRLGTTAEATLRDLCELAPSPWDVVLAEHQAEFLTLAAEAEDAARDNRELLHQGLNDVRDFLDSVRGRGPDASAEQSYGARAGNVGSHVPASSVLVDRDV